MWMLIAVLLCLLFFFFFQAEDGIRDLTVTGVQTCALPIFGADSRISGDDRAALRLKLARARIRRGELDLADSVLLGDSSVDALALRGWVEIGRASCRERV